MLIENLSETSIKKALEDYLNTSKKNRTDERMKFLSYYEGIVEAMEDDLKDYFTRGALRQVPLVCQNVTAKLINSRCIVYKNSPQRENEVYTDHVKSLNATMLSLERITYLLGTSGLRSKFNEEEGKIEYDILSEFYPLFFPFEKDPVAVLYSLYSYEFSQLDSDDIFAFWSKDFHYLVSGHGEIQPVEGNEEMINPYGVIPVTFAHRHPLTTEWFREGASDVVTMNQTVNVMLTEMSLGMRLQALGQPVASGIDDDSAFQLGVDNIITLPEGASFKFESPSSSLIEYVEAIRFFVDSVAYNNNLKTKWSKGKDTVLSGESLKMLEIDLTESIKTDINATWRKFEEDRFRVDREILSVHGINAGSENPIDFSEPRFPLTAQDQRMQWEWEWKHGLSSKEDWFRHNNPDANEKEIEEMMSRNSEEPDEESAEEPAAEPIVGKPIAKPIAKPPEESE